VVTTGNKEEEGGGETWALERKRVKGEE